MYTLVSSKLIVIRRIYDLYYILQSSSPSNGKVSCLLRRQYSYTSICSYRTRSNLGKNSITWWSRRRNHRRVWQVRLSCWRLLHLKAIFNAMILLRMLLSHSSRLGGMLLLVRRTWISLGVRGMSSRWRKTWWISLNVRMEERLEWFQLESRKKCLWLSLITCSCPFTCTVMWVDRQLR